MMLLKNSTLVAVVFVSILATANPIFAGIAVTVNSETDDPVLHDASNQITVKLYSSTTSHVDSGIGKTLLRTVGLNQGGGFDWTVNAIPGWKFIGPNGLASTTQILTFCIDLQENVKTGQISPGIVPLSSAPIDTANGTYGSTVIPTLTPTQVNSIEELWGQDFGKLFQATTLSKGELADAFQLAIWEIEYGNFIVVTAGGGSHDTQIMNQAQTWITTLDASGPQANLYALSATGFQDQVFAVPNPEPASALVWLVIGSVAGYTTLRRRRNATQAA